MQSLASTTRQANVAPWEFWKTSREPTLQNVMSHPNWNDEGTHQLSPADNQDFGGEDKAAQTRRKNAEAQKLYRERKKAYEAGLLSTVHSLQERINILEAQLAYERQQNQASTYQPWLADTAPQLPPYSQKQSYAPLVNPSVRCGPHESHNFGHSQSVNALFQGG